MQEVKSFVWAAYKTNWVLCEKKVKKKVNKEHKNADW